MRTGAACDDATCEFVLIGRKQGSDCWPLLSLACVASVRCFSGQQQPSSCDVLLQHALESNTLASVTQANCARVLSRFLFPSVQRG